jgi:hypothetical protein
MISLKFQIRWLVKFEWKAAITISEYYKNRKKFRIRYPGHKKVKFFSLCWIETLSESRIIL